jgi:hypothetical protein
VADIFKEVDEELRRDRAEELWRKYRVPVIGFIVTVAIGVGAWEVWKRVDQSNRLGASESFAAALEQIEIGQEAAALNQLAELESGSTTYADLAAFKRAELLAEQGQSAEAIEIWDRLAKESDLANGLAEAALIFSVMHQAETGDASVLTARLAPLIGEDRPYRHTAMELQATLALRQGNHGQARDLYQQIADDPEAPSGLRTRATQMLALLGE